MNQIEFLIFTSKTCVPCNRLKIKLQELSPSLFSLIKFVELDPENKYHIMAFPTIIILRNKQQVCLGNTDRICGYRDDINYILEDIYETIK
jgi:thioredoxin-related protein